MRAISWLKALGRRLLCVKTMTPIEHHIRSLSVAKAIENFVYQVVYDGQLLSSDYGVSLNKVRTKDGSAFNLKDPAVQAFMECLHFEEDVVPSAGDLLVAICQAAQKMVSPEAHCQFPELKHFAATQSGSGWEVLDSLLVYLFGYRLSTFFNDVEIFHHRDDTADVGEKCYLIKVETSSLCEPSWSIEGVDSWSAAASNLEYALRLVEGLLVGRIDAEKPENHCEIIESIRVFHGDAELLRAIIEQEFDAEGERVQQTPLLIDGKAIQINGDRSLIQAIAQYAPSLDLKVLKGRVLEDSLGL